MPISVANASGHTKVNPWVWTGSAWAKVKEAWEWTGSAWAKVYSSSIPLIPSRANKTVNQLTTQNVWTRILWDNSTGDPLVSNGVVISGSGSASITCQLTHLSGFAQQWRVLKNSTVISSVTTPSAAASATTVPAVTVPLVPGDVITLEGFSSNAVIRGLQSGSYMTITPV